MSRQRLPRYLQGDDVVTAAQKLLGQYLVTEFNGKITAGRIVETEAYRAPEDKASHAYNYRRTARTEVMFGPSGNAYVYLCYGIHHLFNIICGPPGTPHAVLIRAIEPTHGLKTMMDRRKMTKLKPQLTAGPGVLSRALGITKELSGVPLFNKESMIWIGKGERTSFQIHSSPRVGIDYAGEWVDKPWRFRIKGNPYTSPAK
ncbi:MAG: DNA-3-methyladenine glycosylase [Saprospiraceae bacterium]|nr:DNA-3-methyladenine glycosylase [Saprospiraceae bacterium]